MESTNSRSQNIIKNVLWGNIGNLIISILAFISRSVFITTLGATYLGVNGLFSNILGFLCFAELGIGSAMNYSLYRPIAEGNKERIKSLMKLYQKAYRIIAIIIAILGFAILPFLNIIVSQEAQYEQLHVYYLIFLFNTVTSYLVTYKYAYVTAIQKEYELSIFNTIFTALLTILQIIVLMLTKNFLAYLLVQAVWGLIQKIVTVVYIDQKYPILTEKNIEKLSQKESRAIFKNVKALVIHKIGDVMVNQTDNIIVSIFVNTTAVGLIANYITLQTMVSKFSNTIFNSFIAGFGNMIATDSVKKQNKILQLYNFMGSWIFGFIFVCFITLADPFIELWIGSDMKIDQLTVVLFFLSVYLQNQTITIYNFKVAAGIFNDDKYIAFVQAIVNLIVSIIAVKLIGLPGVYVGTIVQRLIVVVFRPYIVYTRYLKQGLAKYYYYFIKDVLIALGSASLMCFIRSVVYMEVSWIGIILLALLTVIVSNGIFIIMNLHRMREIEFFEYLGRFVKMSIKK